MKNEFKAVIFYQYLDILSIKNFYWVKLVKKEDKTNLKKTMN